MRTDGRTDRQTDGGHVFEMRSHQAPPEDDYDDDDDDDFTIGQISLG
jgi:hypothetical protein